jgi:hypothetical protein
VTKRKSPFLFCDGNRTPVFQPVAFSPHYIKYLSPKKNLIDFAFYYGYQVKKDEMGGICSMNGLTK